MPESVRLPYFGPVPWLVIGGIVGIALLGAHHIGHIFLLLVAFGFAAKWACRWHAANGGTANFQAMWPNCAAWGRWRDDRRAAAAEPPSSGNAAFDDYRREMLRRMEQDHQDFKTFLERLRRAKDKAEFDQFMAERDRGAPAPEHGNGPWPNS